MQHQMMHMFAEPVYRASLQRPFTEMEVACFRRLLEDAQPAVDNAASRSKRVLAEPDLESLREFVMQHLASYLADVFNTTNDVRLVVTQSWLTRTRRQQRHHLHTHPNSVVSGVLYINVAAQDGITFYRDQRSLWYELLPRSESYFNARRFFLPVSVGDLLLFPSHVEHGVDTVQEDIERISLSFNTFFEGELGQDDMANQLKIKVSDP